MNTDILSIPPNFHSEELSQILKLSERFDGYAAYGDELATLANEAMDVWHKLGITPDDLTFIKACLFYEGRRGRIVDGYPDESDMPYLRALRDAVMERG